MIKIICLGKIKEKFFQNAIIEYHKRLSKYTKLEIIELSEETSLKSAVILERERDKILKKLNERDYIIVLDINGVKMNSIELANMLNKAMINYANITFIIGSSYGLHNDIKMKANLCLSFSDLTFPHQLFRIILLEQLYRSYKIINNETYHK